MTWWCHSANDSTCLIRLTRAVLCSRNCRHLQFTKPFRTGQAAAPRVKSWPYSLRKSTAEFGCSSTRARRIQSRSVCVIWRKPRWSCLISGIRCGCSQGLICFVVVASSATAWRISMALSPEAIILRVADGLQPLTGISLRQPCRGESGSHNGRCANCYDSRSPRRRCYSVTPEGSWSR